MSACGLAITFVWRGERGVCGVLRRALRGLSNRRLLLISSPTDRRALIRTGSRGTDLVHPSGADKNKRWHLLALTDMAIGLIDQVRALHGRKGSYLFPKYGDPDKPAPMSCHVLSRMFQNCVRTQVLLNLCPGIWVGCPDWFPCHWATET